jgi:cyclopropane-fatty-acyl-phospholipid synthase
MTPLGRPDVSHITTGRSLERWILRWIFKSLLSPDAVEFAFDDPNPPPPVHSPAIRLRLPNLYHTIQILLRPDIMLGQAYVDGHWSVPPHDLYAFLHLLRSQESSRLQKWFMVSNRFHLLRDLFKQRLFPLRSTRAVVDHYNTNADFVSLVLGSTLSYTCAFFEARDISVDAGQERKLTTIADRASIGCKRTVLDLGSGWGYAAFPLAERYGCEVTGLTISEAQVRFCDSRKLRSLARERLTFIKVDYADYNPQCKFDRVISIGMLEHVGKHQYEFFFNRVSDFMHEDGIALIHSMITEEETATDGWIDKYIFPGGYIPTISEVMSGIERSGCQLMQLFTHSKDLYFKTLEFWKGNLLTQRSACEAILRENGLSQKDAETIIRIWEYFLSSSQIAFSPDYGRTRTAQFVVRRAG